MEIWMLVFTGISAIAAVASAIAAFGAKAEAKRISGAIRAQGDVTVRSGAKNEGVIAGQNTGQIDVRR